MTQDHHKAATGRSAAASAGQTAATQGFDDADAVARYAARPRMQVPGYDALMVMIDLLLAEKLPVTGEIFVLGAGGGLEMTHFARNHAEWRFCGVDPSAEMLALARKTMGPLADRAVLLRGYADDAPLGPFDAATAILVLHFVPVAERLSTLQAIRTRLKPGAPFVCVHHSVPGDLAERAQWFARYAAFAEISGVPRENARAGAAKIAAELPVLSPFEDEALLVQAGFDKVRQFYASLTFRGWVCEAG